MLQWIVWMGVQATVTVTFLTYLDWLLSLFLSCNKATALFLDQILDIPVSTTKNRKVWIHIWFKCRSLISHETNIDHQNKTGILILEPAVTSLVYVQLCSAGIPGDGLNLLICARPPLLCVWNDSLHQLSKRLLLLRKSGLRPSSGLAKLHKYNTNRGKMDDMKLYNHRQNNLKCSGNVTQQLDIFVRLRWPRRPVGKASIATISEQFSSCDKRVLPTNPWTNRDSKRYHEGEREGALMSQRRLILT